MHQGYLAFEAPIICALTSFAAAQIYVYAWWLGVRPWPILIGALGWLIWAIYFAMLAVSAGPDPMIVRGNAMINIRIAELAGGLVLAAWLIIWSRQELRHVPAHRRRIVIAWPAWLRV